MVLHTVASLVLCACARSGGWWGICFGGCAGFGSRVGGRGGCLWAGAVPGTLRTDGVVLAGVANNLAMVGCWWMACSVSSTSCCIASAPWELLMSLIAFVQSVIVFMTLSAWVMVGLVMFLWLKLIVSETCSLLVDVASVGAIMFGGS